MISASGRYAIGEEFGMGYLGVLHRGTDKLAKREVVIEHIKPGLIGDDEKMALIEEEARALTRIDHPHLQRVLEVNRETDALYLVMEKVEGTRLADRVKFGPMLSHDVLTWSLPLGRALLALHAKGIVHRNVCPDTILLDRDNLPVLTGYDLGGKYLAERSGTSGFVAPAHLRRKRLPRAALDVYGLAACMYFAFTNKSPYDVSADDIEQMKSRLLQDRLSPDTLPSAPSMSTYYTKTRDNWRIPDHLRPVLLKALHERYYGIYWDTMGKFVQALEKATRRLSTGTIATLAIVGGVVFFTILVMIVVVGSAGHRKHRPARLPEAPAQAQPVPLEADHRPESVRPQQAPPVVLAPANLLTLEADQARDHRQARLAVSDETVDYLEDGTFRLTFRVHNRDSVPVGSLRVLVVLFDDGQRVSGVVRGAGLERSLLPGDEARLTVQLARGQAEAPIRYQLWLDAPVQRE